MRRMIAVTVCLLLIPCFALAELTVYFLDVGQGDCAIIECDGEAMIIDGGLSGQAETIRSFIQNLKFDEFLYMIATHPDNDHIGGLHVVIEELAQYEKYQQVDYLFAPIKKDESYIFSNLIDEAKRERIKPRVPDKD